MQVLRDEDPDDLPKVWILLQLPLETRVGRKGTLACGRILEWIEVMEALRAQRRPASSSTVKALFLVG